MATFVMFKNDFLYFCLKKKKDYFINTTNFWIKYVSRHNFMSLQFCSTYNQDNKCYLKGINVIFLWNLVKIFFQNNKMIYKNEESTI